MVSAVKQNATPPRQAVLIVSNADGTLEIFAEPNIDVHIARVPSSFSIAAEDHAEQVMELLLPLRFRVLYQRDRLRANGTTHPLLPSQLKYGVEVRGAIRRLNALATLECGRLECV